MRALVDIAKEMEKYGEPANPGLSKPFLESYRALSVLEPSRLLRHGETLLGYLAALAVLAAGRRGLMTVGFYAGETEDLCGDLAGVELSFHGYLYNPLV